MIFWILFPTVAVLVIFSLIIGLKSGEFFASASFSTLVIGATLILFGISSFEIERSGLGIGSSNSLMEKVSESAEYDRYGKQVIIEKFKYPWWFAPPFLTVERAKR